MLIEEIWRPIKDFAEYEISNQGRIRAYIYRGKLYSVPRILQPTLHDGYLRIKLNNGNNTYTRRFVHDLVLETFINNAPEGFECSHLNGNRCDNKVENLIWESRLENQRRRIQHGTTNRGENHGQAKLTQEEVNEIRNLSQQGYYNNTIARKFGISSSHVSRIVNHKFWKEIP